MDLLGSKDVSAERSGRARLDQFGEVQRRVQPATGKLDPGTERGIGQLGRGDPLGPMAGDVLGDAVQLRLVDQEAGIDIGRIGDDAQP